MSTDRQRFKIKVGNLEFTGVCDGTLVKESWRYKMPLKKDRATFKGPQELKRLTLTIYLDGDVQGLVFRPENVVNHKFKAQHFGKGKK